MQGGLALVRSWPAAASHLRGILGVLRLYALVLRVKPLYPLLRGVELRIRQASAKLSSAGVRSRTHAIKVEQDDD